jgi:hypothetical protein
MEGSRGCMTTVKGDQNWSPDASVLTWARWDQQDRTRFIGTSVATHAGSSYSSPLTSHKLFRPTAMRSCAVASRPTTWCGLPSAAWKSCDTIPAWATCPLNSERLCPPSHGRSSTAPRYERRSRETRGGGSSSNRRSQVPLRALHAGSRVERLRTLPSCST